LCISELHEEIRSYRHSSMMRLLPSAGLVL